MSLVIARGLGLAYGRRVLLDEGCFSIGPHDRIGLVCANGTGRSTLMKVLAGQLQHHGLRTRPGLRAWQSLPKPLILSP